MKSKVYYKVIFVLLLCLSCQHQKTDLETEVMNDFLSQFIPEHSVIIDSIGSYDHRTLLLSDSLGSTFSFHSLRDLAKRKASEFHHNDDPDWSALLSKLLSSDLPSQPVDFSKVRQHHPYQITPASSYEQFTKDNFIGIIALSRIVFNKSKTKACLYYSYICGGECGEGEIVFLEKSPNGWKHAYSTFLWVA